MKVLVLRAIEDARRTAARLAERGHQAIVSPAIVFRAIPHTIPDDRFDALIATSAHAFVDEPRNSIVSIPLFVVGEKTLEAARRAGFSGVAETAPNAVALVEAIRRNVSAGARAIYLAGRDRKTEIEDALRPMHDLLTIETYAAERATRLTLEAAMAARAGTIDVVLHYSRRSAEIYRDVVRAEDLVAHAMRVRHVAISQDAAAPLRTAGFDVAAADAPDESSMFETMEKGRKR
ncbi:MAG: uroporphyrinogen-III synthase [Hyphomicrobiales bacterium]|nr:uroporphyrinogen-III synthase [Hyphomicrobiales bacterium]